MHDKAVRGGAGGGLRGRLERMARPPPLPNPKPEILNPRPAVSCEGDWNELQGRRPRPARPRPLPPLLTPLTPLSPPTPNPIPHPPNLHTPPTTPTPPTTSHPSRFSHPLPFPLSCQRLQGVKLWRLVTCVSLSSEKTHLSLNAVSGLVSITWYRIPFDQSAPHFENASDRLTDSPTGSQSLGK